VGGTDLFSFSGLVVAFAVGSSLFFMDVAWRRDYRKNPRRALAELGGATALYGIIAFALITWVIPWVARPHVSCAQAVAAEIQAAKNFDPYGLTVDENGDDGSQRYNDSIETVAQVCDEPWEQQLAEGRMIVWCETRPDQIQDLNLVPYGECYGGSDKTADSS
jgi:hypothetical protein